MSEEEASEELDFPEELSEHSEYFVVAGVFAAAAAYIYQTTDGLDGGPTSPGFVSFLSLLALSFLMVVLFYQQLKREVGSWPSLYRMHFEAGNLEIATFSALLSVSVMSILARATVTETGLILFVTVLYMLGLIYVSMRVLREASTTFPKHPANRIAIIGLFGLIASFTAIESITWAQSNLEIIELQKQSLSNPGSLAVFFFLLSLVMLQILGSTAILAFLFSIPIVLLQKYRGTGYYNAETE